MKVSKLIGLLGAFPRSVQKYMKGEDYHIPVDSKTVQAEALKKREHAKANKVSKRKKERAKGRKTRKNRGRKR